MSVMLDSVDLDEARQASCNGWVSCLTTNPALLARGAKPPEQTLSRLAELPFRQVFYQLTAAGQDALHREIDRARSLLGEKLVIKLLPTLEGFELLASIADEIPCCVTAVFSPTQAYIARQVGARYIAIYVNKGRELGVNSLQLIRDCNRLLDGSQTEIIAASLHSSAQAAEALLAGAAHLTAPYQVLLELVEHDATTQVIENFQRNGWGI